MQVYKKQLERAENRISEMKEENQAYENAFSVMNRHWQMIEEDASGLMEAVGLSDGETTDYEADIKSLGSFMSCLLNYSSQKSEESSEDRLENILYHRTGFVRNLLAAITKKCDSKITEQSQSGDSSLIASYDKLLAKNHSILEELNIVKDKLEIAEKRADDADNMIEDFKYQLAQADRRLQREKSDIARKIFSANTPESVEVSDIKTADNVGDNAASQQMTPEIIKIVNEHAEMATEIDTTKALVEAKDAKIEELRLEIKNIQSLLDQELLDKTVLPDHYVTSTSVYKDLFSQYEFYKSETERLREEQNFNISEIEKLKEEISKQAEKFKEDEAMRRMALENEIEKLSKDLERIRNARDSIQKALEMEKTKSKKDSEEVKDLKIGISASTTRIKGLQNEIARFKKLMVSETGNKRLYEDVIFASELPEIDSQNPEKIKEMKTLVESLSLRAEEAEIALKSLEGSDKEELSSKVKENHQLKIKVEQYEKVFGDLRDFNGKKEGSSPEELLKSKQHYIDTLELKIKTLETAQQDILKEIDAISTSHSSLEQRQSKQASIIADNDAKMTKLSAEKTKYEQKISTLMKERDARANVSVALKKQLKALEDEKKKLVQDNEKKAELKAALENEVSNMKSLCLKNEEKSKEYRQLIESLSARAEKNTSRYSEVRKIIADKEAALSKLRMDRQKLEEEVRKSQAKIKSLDRRIKQFNSLFPDIAEKTSNTVSDPELFQMYKKLAQCSVCEARLKSHVLVKCMHVFCKQCIDTRLETRQRKCPQCAAMFGPNDVKQIYI